MVHLFSPAASTLSFYMLSQPCSSTNVHLRLAPKVYQSPQSSMSHPATKTASTWWGCDSWRRWWESGTSNLDLEQSQEFGSVALWKLVDRLFIHVVNQRTKALNFILDKRHSASCYAEVGRKTTMADYPCLRPQTLSTLSTTASAAQAGHLGRLAFTQVTYKSLMFGNVSDHKETGFLSPDRMVLVVRLKIFIFFFI